MQDKQKKDNQKAKGKNQKNQRVKEKTRGNQRARPKRTRVKVLRNLIDLLEAKVPTPWIIRKAKAQEKGEDLLKDQKKKLPEKEVNLHKERKPKRNLLQRIKKVVQNHRKDKERVMEKI
jgi:hypothetical protein